MSGALAIRGGTVLDQRGPRQADVVVEDGRLSAVAPDLDVSRGARVLDAGGCVVAPGLVDLHAHLRQPGDEEAETIESGSRAAALGGYTAVVAMPNTEPPVDSAAVVKEVLAHAEGALTEVAVAGAITVGREGERLAPLAEMAALGVRLFTDDGAGVQDGGLMRRALDYARGLGVVLAQHCEDRALGDGAMHEGAWSSRLGIPGQPSAAEEVMVARDLALVRTTGAPMHFLHLSTAGSVALLRRARSEGLSVTAEVTPHHLSLTDAEVRGYDPVFKVNPPLRTGADIEALRAALAEGVIDAVATDHAPHLSERKEVPFAEAPPGMIGLETALAVAWGVMVAVPRAARRSGSGRDAEGRPGAEATEGAGVGTLTREGLFAAMSWQPAAIAGLADQGGPIAPGAAANLCVFDPEARWRVEPEDGASRSRNSPFAGRVLTGRVRHTVRRGDPVVVDAEAQR